MTKTINYKILPFEMIYLKEVIKLLNITFSTVSKNNYFSENYFKWKHIDNPYGKSHMLLAIDDNGQVIGFRAFMRWSFLDNTGKIQNFVRPVDSAIHPNARSLGLFKKLTFELVKSLPNNIKIFNNPNRNSYPIYTKKDWGWHLDHKHIFTVTLIYRLFYLTHKATKGKIIPIYKILELKNIKSVIRGSSFDLKYFKWRYIDCPVKNYLAFSLNNKYILIFQVKNIKSIRAIILMDIIYSNNNFEKINISNFDLNSIIPFGVLIMSNYLKQFLNISWTLSLNTKMPKKLIVTRNVPGLLSDSGIEITTRELELF